MIAARYAPRDRPATEDCASDVVATAITVTAATAQRLKNRCDPMRVSWMESRGWSMQLAAELPLDRRQIAPDMLAGDLAVAKLEYVKEAKAHLAAAAFAQELT